MKPREVTARAVRPAAEDGADGAPELTVRILREGGAGLLPHDLLVAADQRLEVVRSQFRIEVEAAPLLDVFQFALEFVVIDVQHHGAIHLDEAAVTVPGKAGVAAGPRQPVHGPVVQAEIEHGVHHARHRGARAGADGDEQRIVRIAEAAADDPFDPGNAGLDLPGEIVRIGSAVIVIPGADFGCDREARRDRQTDAAHLCEIRALAAQQIPHVRGTVGGAVAETVDPPRHRRAAGRIRSGPVISLRSAKSRRRCPSLRGCSKAAAGGFRAGPGPRRSP